MALYSKWEVWKITGMRDGCIFKTKSVGKEIWVKIGLTTEQQAVVAKEAGGDLLASLSTNRAMLPENFPRSFKRDDPWFEV